MDMDIPLTKKLYLSWLAVFAPKRFITMSLGHTLQQNNPRMSVEETHQRSLSRLRNGYGGAFMHIAFVSMIGVIVGQILGQRFQSSPGAAMLGGFGGLIIL